MLGISASASFFVATVEVPRRMEDRLTGDATEQSRDRQYIYIYIIMYLLYTSLMI